MTQGFGGFLLFLGAGWGCCCGARCRTNGGPGFRCVLLSLESMMKIKIFNLLGLSIDLLGVYGYCGSFPSCREENHPDLDVLCLVKEM